MYLSAYEGDAAIRFCRDEGVPFTFLLGVDVKGKSKPRRLGVRHSADDSRRFLGVDGVAMVGGQQGLIEKVTACA
jgi:hypothetical protein